MTIYIFSRLPKKGQFIYVPGWFGTFACTKFYFLHTGSKVGPKIINSAVTTIGDMAAPFLKQSNNMATVAFIELTNTLNS